MKKILSLRSNNNIDILFTRTKSKKSKHISCQKYRVYGVCRDKNGYPQFLIYEENQWKWKSAKYFTPENIDDRYSFTVGISPKYKESTHKKIIN